MPNALDSEKYPPAEDNVIIDNDIFWNNFNFHQGKPPFAVRDEGTAALVPIGTGILLLGGRGNRIENNRIYGNFLTGVAAVEGILLTKNPQARSLERNIVRNNVFGLNGTDVNGSDVMYDGNGTDNCFSMDGRDVDVPGRPLDVRRLLRAERVQRHRAAADDRLHRRGRREGVEQASASGQARVHPARGVRVRKSLIAVLAGAALLSAAPVQGATKKTVNAGRQLLRAQDA